MTTQRLNLIIGAFAMTGIIVMVGLVIAFGGARTLMKDTYDIRVHFPGGVVGIQGGEAVTLNGKRIGQTKTIDFHNPSNLAEGVDVRVAIDQDFKLPVQSEIQVPENIMGIGRPIIQLVILDPVDPARVPEDGSAYIHGRMVSITDKVLGPDMLSHVQRATNELGNLAEALRPVAKEVARLLEVRDVRDVDMMKATANMDTLIQRFDGTLKNLSQIIGDERNQTNLRLSMDNIRKMSETGIGVMENLSAVSGDAKLAMTDVRNLMRRLTLATDQMSSVMTKLDQTMTSINSGTGTAGLLLKDNRLYEELVLAVRRLTKTLDDYREVADIIKQGNLRVNPF